MGVRVFTGQRARQVRYTRIVTDKQERSYPLRRVAHEAKQGGPGGSVNSVIKCDVRGYIQLSGHELPGLPGTLGRGAQNQIRPVTVSPQPRAHQGRLPAAARAERPLEVRHVRPG